MIDKRYHFGHTLRETILLGRDEKTELRTIFEKKLLQRIGLSVCHSDFSQEFHTPCLFLSVEISKHKNLFLSSEWENIHGIFYPRGKMREELIACFNDSVVEVGLPALKFSSDEGISIASVYDYKCMAANLYFHVNIVEIDRKARQAFPNSRFHIRFCRSEHDEHYYLIFDDESSKERADKKGMISKITDYIFSLCKKNDPLHIFDDNSVNPIITSKEEIKRSGSAMGIMRENPDFDTL